MKSQKGVTLSSLVIYIIIATILVSSIAMFSSYCFSNMKVIKDQDLYGPEFGKFNMFFLADVKKNKTAIIDDNNTKVTLSDGTVYQYNTEEKAIYRNETKITKRVENVKFTTSDVKVSNTIKQIIKVDMSIGGSKNFSKSIEYVLKYW